MDPEQLKKQLEDLTKEVQGLMDNPQPPVAKAPPATPTASPAVPLPQSEAPATKTPADVAPSAPSAGAPTQITPSSYKTYVEYEYVGEPDPESDAGLVTEEMNYTAGQGAAPAPAQPGDTRSNIDKIISGERTATSRRYLPKFAEGDNVLLTVKGKPAAVIRIKAIYGIAGSENGQAILRDLKIGTEIRKPIAEMAAAEGYDLDSYSKKIYNAAVAPEGATSPVPEQGGLPVPPKGETPASVAPGAISGESMPGDPAPEKMTTASTLDQGMPTDLPPVPEQGQEDLFAGVSDEDLSSSVPKATMSQDEIIASDEVQARGKTKWTRPVTATDGPRIGVIGSAGRISHTKGKFDGARLTAADWAAMTDHISSKVGPDTVLVSGGAAWADHLAVKLFLDGKVAGLILHLPNPEAEIRGTAPTTSRSGQIALRQHEQFSETVFGNPEASQNQLIEALDKGAVATFEEATSDTGPFFRRNELVAQSAEDGLSAYTLDPDEKGPGDGGTGDTWKKSKLAREKKRSVDIRKISPADPDEAARVAKVKNKGDMRAAKYGDAKVSTQEQAAVVRISKLLTLGKRTRLNPQEINDLTLRVVRALRKTPMNIDDELASILPISNEPSVSVKAAGLRMRAGEYLNSYGSRLAEVTTTGERKAFIDRLVDAGIPRDVLESASAGDDDSRQFKPFFSSEKVTAESADASNRKKSSRLLKQVVSDLGTLQESGRLRALTHPSVAEGIDFLLRHINAYRVDMASGAMNNTQLRPVGGNLALDFFGKRAPGAGKDAIVIQYIQEVLRENGADPAIIEAVANPPAEGEEPWSYEDPDTKQKITIEDVIRYGNGSSTGYRRYAVDKTGIIPQEWLIVDQAGLDITGPFANDRAGGASTKASIGFSLEPISGDRDTRFAFAEFYLHRMGISDPTLREKIVSKYSGGVDMQEYIDYTRNSATVGNLIKTKLSGTVDQLGNIKVWKLPMIDGGTVTAGGRRIQLSPGSIVVVNEGDLMDREITKLAKRYDEVSTLTIEKGIKGPKPKAAEILFVGPASEYVKIDPIVYQAVRHTYPVKHPEGHDFVEGAWVPAVVAEATSRRLLKFADMLEASGQDASAVREIADTLSKGVFVGNDYRTEDTIGLVKLDDPRLNASNVSSNGSPMLVLPGDDGKYPDRREMLDEVRLSDPFEEFTRIDYPASEQTVNLDAGYRLLREVQEAEANGIDRPLSDSEIELIGRFEEDFQRSSQSPGQFKEKALYKRLVDEFGATAAITRMTPKNYEFDLGYDRLQSGPFADQSSGYDSTKSYSEPRVGQARIEPGRPFAPSTIPDLPPADQAIVSRVMRNLTFIYRYHAERAKWWNQQGDKFEANRSTAILSELADDMRKVVGLAYEPNLRSAALMTGFSRKIENLLGSDALAEDIYPEFVKMLSARTEVDSDASWLDPSRFLSERELGKNQSEDVLNLYKEYVGLQTSTLRDMASRTAGSLGVGQTEQEQTVAQPADEDVSTRQSPTDLSPGEQANLIPLSEFSRLEGSPTLPAAPYEATSQARYTEEVSRVDAQIKSQTDSVVASRKRLVSLRKELSSLGKSDPSYTEKKFQLDSRIKSVSESIDQHPAKLKALKAKLKTLKKQFGGQEVLSKKFTIGSSFTEGPTTGRFEGLLKAIVTSSTVDGKVNTRLVANKIAQAWSIISLHYAVDRSSPITKINTNKDSTHFKYGLTQMLQAGHSVEMDFKEMFTDVMINESTGEIFDPGKELAKYLDSLGNPGSDQVVLGTLDGAAIDKVESESRSESFHWLRSMLRENAGKITAVWHPSEQKIWLQPAGDFEAEGGLKLSGVFQQGGKDSPSKISGTQTMSPDEAEALIRDLGLSEVMSVVRSPEPVEGKGEDVRSTGVKPYKIQSRTPAARQGSSSLVKAGTQSTDGDSATRVFNLLADYQLRANFFGAMRDALSKMGVDISAEVNDKIKAISLDPDGVKDLAEEVSATSREPIGPFEMTRIVNGDQWRNSDEMIRLRHGYPEPIRRAMDDLLARRSQGRVDVSTSERDMADLIDAHLNAAKVASPKSGRGKMIGYGVGGSLAGIIAGYVGNQMVAGQEEANAQLPMNVGFEALGALPKIGGPVASVAALGLTAATGGDIWRTVASIAGGLAGGAIGGAVGTVGGPVGTFAGSAAGGTAGSFAADALYTSIFGGNSPSRNTVPVNVAMDSGKVGGSTENYIDNPMRSVDSTMETQNNIFGG